MKKNIVLCFFMLICCCCFANENFYLFNFGDKTKDIEFLKKGKNYEFVLQDVSELLGWNCVACGRCGDDQVDILGDDIVLIKWNEKKAIFSKSGKIIKLPTENRLVGDKTYVSIKLLTSLGYKVNINHKKSEVNIFKTKIILDREKNHAQLPKAMTKEELKKFLNEHKMWDGVFTPIQDAEAALLDVRNEDEYNAGHIPGSVLYPLQKLKEELPRFPKDRKIIVYCAVGGRSAEAMIILKRQGFLDVENFGGYNKWIEE